MSNDKTRSPGADIARTAAMREIVAAMDPTTRAIFLRHRLDGWSYASIAEERAIGITEVEQHIARAILTLDLGLSSRGL